MSDVRIIERAELRDPILIAGWAGWNDAGESATSAVRFMRRRWRARAVAEVDAEEFYDFTQARPRVRLEAGERVLDWPENIVYAFRSEGDGPDFLLLSGIEPHLQWERYCDAVLEICRFFGVRAVITLGALLAEASHSRPISVSGSSEDEELRARLGLPPPRTPGYQGPTGIVGVFSQAARRHGHATASMWANVPYYVQASPNPKGSLALLEQLNHSLGLGLQLHDLEVFVARFDAQVQEEVDKNPGMAEYARRIAEEADEQLEQMLGGEDEYDDEDEDDELPDVDAMVDDLERFLREQRED